MATRIERALIGLAAVVGVVFGACATGDDSKCEVICNCEDRIQYVGAGYCDRETFRCASGVEECASLCEDNGGLKEICSLVEDQPVGHVGPEAVCPGVDPLGRDCEPLASGCGVTGEGGPAPALGVLVLLGLGLLRRRRAR